MTAGIDSGRAGGWSSLDPLRWLLSEWWIHSEDRITTERWTEVSADTFEGSVESRSRETGEIVPVESLRLVAMSEGVFYLAKVPEHDLPIAFKMTSCDGQTVVFENPAHDFPKVIAYRMATDGVLTVHVTDGADEGFTVRYTKRDASDTGPP